MLATQPRKPHGSPRLSHWPMAASPPRKSHSKSFVGQTRGPALGMVPSRDWWGFRHHKTSRRQSPTSGHACCRARNREERRRTLLARNPAMLPLKSTKQAAWRSPRLSQGPRAASPPRKSHSENFVGQTRGAALGTAPARGQWGCRHHGTSRRQSPTSAHSRCRAGNGEERGQTLRARNPTTLPLKSPREPHRVRRASVRGPWSAIAVARCTLAGGHTAPHDPPRPLGHPIVCSGSMRSCENKGPPQLPFHKGRRRIGRGGETPPPIPFSRALCGEPRPAPRVMTAYMCALARGPAPVPGA